MSEVNVFDLVKPNHRQGEFMDRVLAYVRGDSQQKYMLYGGAKGGGKSYVLRWMMALLPIYWYQAHGIKGVRTGLFCQTYDDLRDMHITKIREELPLGPNGIGVWNESSREIRLHPRYGGGILAFRNLAEPSEYNGKEFAAMAVDEITSQPAATFHALRSCLRWPGIKYCPFAAGTNPGGPGHAWVRACWIDNDLSVESFENMRPEQFGFVQAFAKDNPALDEEYYKDLESLPDDLRRRYLEGDWDIWEGQYFSEFRTSLHVVEPFPIPSNWIEWRSLDHGSTAPTCCLGWAMNPDDGSQYITKEYYRPGLTAEVHADNIYELWAGREVRYTAADPSMWQHSGVVSKGEKMTSPEDIYREHGIPLKRAVNDRVAGWNNCRQSLALMPNGQPRLRIFNTCRNLIRQIPLALHDERKPEDIAQGTHIEDHALDAWRYGLSLVAVGDRKYKPSAPAYAARRYA